MKILLIVFLLTVQSSYLQDVERPSSTNPDTIQFVLISGQAWRIKTFAIDHDVHSWSLGPMDRSEFEALALSNSEKHYGDILARRVAVETEGDFESLKSELLKAGLTANIEVNFNWKFAYWTPEPGVYENKSRPK